MLSRENPFAAQRPSELGEYSRASGAEWRWPENNHRAAFPAQEVAPKMLKMR